MKTQTEAALILQIDKRSILLAEAYSCLMRLTEEEVKTLVHSDADRK